MTDVERAANARASDVRTSCMNSADLIEYFVGTLGVPIEKVVEGLRVDADFLRNTANWIDNYDTYLLYRNCQRAVAGFSHRDWYKVGQATHSNNAAGYFKMLLKLLSTDVIFRRIPQFISHTSTVSTYRVVSSEPGHIRYRYAIPDREIALGYTIGSECWYHLGILSTLPRLQDESSRPAAADHEICSMPVGHILENVYGAASTDYAYTEEGIEAFGTLFGRWVKLRPLDGDPQTFGRDYRMATRSEANALLIVRELSVGGVNAFLPGEIYDAPHCLFDIRYENRSIWRRLRSYFRLGAGYYEEQLRKTEKLYLDFHKLRVEEKRLEQTLKNIVGDPILVSSVAGATAPITEGVAPAPVTLTRREREIADRVALGMTNGDIADELFISRETVKRHVYNIYTKLGVKNRVQLARKLADSEADQSSLST